jgi:hypothetical protein
MNEFSMFHTEKHMYMCMSQRYRYRSDQLIYVMLQCVLMINIILRYLFSTCICTCIRMRIQYVYIDTKLCTNLCEIRIYVKLKIMYICMNCNYNKVTDRCCYGDHDRYQPIAIVSRVRAHHTSAAAYAWQQRS